jgi:nucleotide-binding universal stress UspA family protein
MRVVVAVDGSGPADDAVALVDAIAWPADAVLRVIGVIEPTVPMLGLFDSGGVLTPEVEASVTASMHQTVEGAVERLRDRGRSVEGEVLHGRAATTIVDDARDFGADLLVVGSRGHGTIASLLLGSVSGEVVDHAPCPVLVARTTDLARVVLATDGSPSAKAAERVLTTWPIFAGLPIHVLSVVDTVRPWTTDLLPTMSGLVLDAYSADVREAVKHERIASDSAARLRDGNRVADWEVRAGDAAAEVITVVEDQRAELVVLGSRGHTGVTRLLLGSVARNVLSGSTSSVLIVRDGTVAPPDQG